MNQFVAKKPDGTTILGLILEPGNLERLKKKDPILVNVRSHFPDGIPSRLELYITYSETPVADAREMAKHSEMSFDERTHVAKTIRPHCPECKSTIEQLGGWKSESPVTLVFCPNCGCVLSALGKLPESGG